MKDHFRTYPNKIFRRFLGSKHGFLFIVSYLLAFTPLYSIEIDEKSPYLLELLDLCHLSHDGSLDSIVAITQKQWLQMPKERWQFEPREQEKINQALPLLLHLGCIEAVHPSQDNYHYAWILGGTYLRMKSRIDHVIREWQRGVKFKEIVLLSGERFLDGELESSVLEHQTEANLLFHLWTTASAPSELTELPVTLINAPGHDNADGKWQRPNRKDTLLEWLKQQPSPGTCLVFSSQPFIGYDRAVVKTCVPDSFLVEVIGPEANPHTLLAVYLDNLARCLYQEQLLRGKK